MCFYTIKIYFEQRVSSFVFLYSVIVVGLSFAQENIVPMGASDILSNIQQLGDWNATDRLLLYTGNELTDYINGGALLYFSYNFKQACIKEYGNNSGATLMVEIYEFDKSENAYGIYSFDTDGQHPQIGNEATYAEGLLRFWKGRFFVRILAEYKNTAIEHDVLSFGKEIAQKIEQSGAKPELLARIPESNVDEGSIRYFHENICLNNVYYITGDNVLNLSANTEAVTYEYELEGILLRVILIQYLKKEDAKAAYASFVATHLGEKLVSGLDYPEDAEMISEGENRKYVGIRLTDTYLIVVFEAISEDSCSRILHLQGGLL